MEKHFCLSVLFALAAGCGDDSAPTSRPVECEEIVNKCHDLDTGPEDIHMCHENAEGVWSAQQCMDQQAFCFSICVPMSDGGPPEAADDTPIDTTTESTDDGPVDANNEG